MGHSKLYNAIVILFGLTSCNFSEKEKNIKSDSTISSSTRVKMTIEEKISDTIFKLPEVVDREKYIEQQTKGKRKLVIWFVDTPSLPNKKYYWIKVAEDNGAAMVTHFNFFVYPDSVRIMFYNTSTDTELSLEKWRTLKNGI